MLHAVAENGFAATTVADVVARAAVSRSTFYAQFPDKEACFTAAYDYAMDLALGRMTEAAASRPDAAWQERVRSDLTTYLDVLMSEPALAVTLHVEVLAAGPVALEHRAELLSVLASRLANLNQLAKQDVTALRDLPPAIFALYTGGLDELIRDRMRTGHVQGLKDLAEPLLEATYAMFGS